MKEQIIKEAENNPKYDYEVKEVPIGYNNNNLYYAKRICTKVDNRYPKHITVINYQGLMAFLKTKPSIPDHYYYIIFDESHFFFEDSLFNAFSTHLLNQLIKKFKVNVHIFMSATLKDVENCIIKTYNDFNKIKFTNTPVFLNAPGPINPLGFVNTAEFLNTVGFLNMAEFSCKPVGFKCIHYKNTYSNNKYKTFIYNNTSDLISRIKKSESSEKWLIFVSSKVEGKELKRDIEHSILGRSVYFLTAEGKKSKAWKQIIESSTYPQNILITTKVLDNGVNIKDENVKHVVLPFCYEIDFIQMLGRRRNVKEDETLSLYIKPPSTQILNSRIKELDKLIRIIKKVDRILFKKPNNILEKEDLDYKKISLIRTLWENCDKSINSLFYMNDDLQLIPNEIARYKIMISMEFYTSLRNSASITNAYLNKVKVWLGNNQNDIASHIITPQSPDLYSFIEKYKNSTIESSEDLEKFYKEFFILYKCTCHYFFGNDPIKLKELLNVKKEKKRRKYTINKCLENLGYDCRLTKKNNTWFLEKIEDNKSPDQSSETAQTTDSSDTIPVE